MGRLKVGYSAYDLMYYSIILLIILTCMPVTQCLPGFIRMAVQASSIGLFVIGIMLNGKWNYFLRYVLSILFFATYVFSVWQYKQGFFTCVFNVMACVQFCFYGAVISTEELAEKRDKIIKLILIVMTITAITTIIGLMQYPLAARELGRSVAYTRTVGDFEEIKWAYRLNNIAGWSQIYGMVFFIPICMMLLKKSRKLYYFLPIIICEICIIFSQITFALLLSIVLIFLFAIASRTTKTNKNRSIITAVALIVLIAVFVNKNVILRTMINFTSNHDLEFLARKLNELYLVTQHTVTGDAELRFSLYQDSINIFLNYPILGFFATGQDTKDVFCYHSEFFDYLGFYGIVGMIILIIVLIVYIRYILRFNNIFIFISCLLTVLVLFILNPIWYSPQIFIGSVMGPLLLYRVSDNSYRRIDNDAFIGG